MITLREMAISAVATTNLTGITSVFKYIVMLMNISMAMRTARPIGQQVGMVNNVGIIVGIRSRREYMESPKPEEYVEGWTLVTLMIVGFLLYLMVIFMPRSEAEPPQWTGHEQVIQQWMKEARK